MRVYTCIFNNMLSVFQFVLSLYHIASRATYLCVLLLTSRYCLSTFLIENKSNRNSYFHFMNNDIILFSKIAFCIFSSAYTVHPLHTVEQYWKMCKFLPYFKWSEVVWRYLCMFLDCGRKTEHPCRHRENMNLLIERLLHHCATLSCNHSQKYSFKRHQFIYLMI